MSDESPVLLLICITDQRAMSRQPQGPHQGLPPAQLLTSGHHVDGAGAPGFPSLPSLHSTGTWSVGHGFAPFKSLWL